ncbi:MAG TPA: peptidoglycan-binding domain-containing protein [Leptospiraceae bacterium]|nr:peptidoglycan-binding domain-containing protein [Leptospiraceae bacterium]HMW03599.1 peptidoglycan-binding domain-containing protein [Leptospiraceae bacterium]HMY29480.1 peptidoglycan-binding domain-containing protein [Leptospiraceae bacterium]HMZ64768.1 peptidoglycan-binding domain-containing protein [Leptospiraceae bacterium]HNA10251.1 peptidoglycan-binding domain-containing protein [Leptospiraceae bacterium]
MKYNLFFLCILTLFYCNTPPKREATKNPKEEYDHCYIKSFYPAEYKTIEDRILIAPASIKEETIPALIKTVEETVIDKPGKSVWVAKENDRYCFEEIPPTYKTIKRDVLISPETTKMVEHPDEYKVVTRKELLQEARVEWTEILCENKYTPELIKKIQRSLQAKGYPTGREAELDNETFTAINKFQKANQLKVNKTKSIYLETIQALGVK